MSKQRLGLAVVAVVTAIAAAIGGYALGASEAPSKAEAREARIAARELAFAAAEKQAYVEGKRRGLKSGRRDGLRAGARAGRSAGTEAAEVQLATIAEEEAAAELEYDPQLPNGDPGYLLPEDERTLSCVGISAVDGECVGD